MEKNVKNYKTNLIVVVIAFIVAILTNLHLFTSGNKTHLLYALAMIILGGLSIYCLILIKNDIKTSTDIALIIGPIMTIMNLIEGFNYGKGIIVNYRIASLFLMIGGILILINALKIKKTSN